MKISKFFFVAAFMTASSLTAFSQKTTLRFQPANGSQYTCKTTTKTTVLQEVMGQKMEIISNSLIANTYNIKDAGTNKDLKTTIDSISTRASAMGNEIILSSENDDESSKPMRDIKGKSYTATVTPLGKIEKVTGMDELVNASEGNNDISKMFSKDALTQMASQSFRFYPENAVNVGDTWTTNSQITTPVAINTKNTYKLLKIDNDIATLEVSGDLATDGEVKTINQGMEVIMTLSGTQSGTMKVNIKNGIPISSNIKQDMKGTTKVMGMEIPLTVINDVSFICTPK
ncbi:MAG: DUF6263 family protein [Niabella sp.]